MTIQVAERLSRREIRLNFAAAEVDSPRWGNEYARHIGEQAATRLRSIPIDAWSKEDKRNAETGLRAVRAGYVYPLLDLVESWSVGELAVADLAVVRLINLAPFVELAPSRCLWEFVQALDAGRATRDDGFAHGYRSLRGRFDPARMRGLPVLVAEGLGGPYTEAEGLTRLCCVHSLHLEGRPVPERLRVAVGVSPRIREWSWY